MFPTHTQKVLKEWATVLEALKTGQQIILFRKGGIIEAHDEFQVESPEFFLYPTYLHQSVPDVQKAYQPWIQESEARRPGKNENGEQLLELNLFARVEKVMQAKGVERLRELTDAFIWTPEYVEKAWSWKPEKPAYILFLRVYRMETPQFIAERPEYGGCVSWIDLNEAVPVGNLTPVLSDNAFNAQVERIQTQLKDSAVLV